ncbi:tyrosine-type recombinase/integrase [Lactiplantibacillus plantarum]|uniref:tyrosine-type recombinase/integrase n=1 Tax=Lactiplantibacillus plantarum TaxID=1590 RepID=UPI00175CD138|nr:site-specific integrase [Lactiplantibacillus plantarum]GFF01069.1 integrase [Lactiplantibacillus plantarum]
MASIQKRNGKWSIRLSYKSTDGKYKTRRKSFSTKSAAQTYLRRLENAKASGVDLSKDYQTLGEYFKDWFETYREPNITSVTANRYKVTMNDIDNYFKDRLIGDIDRRQYQQFINTYGKKHARGTVRKTNSLIRAAVRNAVYESIIPRDFTKDIILTFDKSRDWKVEYLNMEEIKQLTQYLISGLNTRYTSRYMILTALFTGARLGEIMALTWKDINFNFKTISITKAWNYQEGGGFKPTKNDHSIRTIRVNQQILDILKPLKKANPNTEQLVFYTHNGQIPSSSAVNKKLRECLQDLDIHRTGFHFHSLRHSHVAFLLANNVDLYVISKRLGHSDIGITSRIYAYLIDEYKARYDDKIDASLDELMNNNTDTNELKKSI